ncbi:VOC family protein [Kitasatospora sp. NPDC058965]|uniref:VOC family protein n=1 Tax=Kitasatospora sp. NPDC058965 TaxID=3346682 RepID=UPI003690F49D
MSQLIAPPVFQLGHIGLNVTDADRSRAFYQRVFGLELHGESTGPEHRYVYLGQDGKTLVTLWEQSKGAFAADTPGLHHLAFRVESVERLHELEQVLRELGAEFAHEGVVPHREGADSGGLFFTDPDGLRLEAFTTGGVAAEGTDAPSGAAPTCGFF